MPQNSVKQLHENKKGFTLVELLIVVAIIGILASIVLVSISSARQRAKMAEFKSTVSSLNSALISACDSGSEVPMWPAGNNSGSIIDGNELSCSGGMVSGGSVVSNPEQTGTSCIGNLGQDGVVFSSDVSAASPGC